MSPSELKASLGMEGFERAIAFLLLLVLVLAIDQKLSPSPPAPKPHALRAQHHVVRRHFGPEARPHVPDSCTVTPHPQPSTCAKSPGVPRALPAPCCGSAEGVRSVRVLLFMAVGRAHLPLASASCTAALAANVSLFLAHYDNAQGEYARLGWYARVRFSVSYAASKAQFVYNELVLDAQRGGSVAAEFSHVWLADEDVAFPPPHAISGFVRTSASLGVLVSQPLLHSWNAHALLLASGAGGCTARFVDFIEVQLPLLRTCALLETYASLLRAGQTTDWGVDRLWCRLLAERWRLPPERACAIIAAGAFEHRPHAGGARTKLGGGSAYNRTAAGADAECLLAAHPQHQSRCLRFGCALPVQHPRESTATRSAADGAAPSKCAWMGPWWLAEKKAGRALPREYHARHTSKPDVVRS